MYRVGKRNFKSYESYLQWKENKKIAANRPEVRKRNSEARNEYWAIEENRVSASKERLERWANPEYKEKVAETHRIQWQDEEFREKQRKADEIFWNSPETLDRRKELLLKQRQGRWLRPNHFEEKYISIFNKYFPKQWKYVGGGKTAIEIGGKVPDFIHTKKKMIIELFGIYWHKPEDEAIRIEHFKKYGYKTLVIWENENIPDAIVKIKKFAESSRND